MPRLNAHGAAVMGVGGQVSIDNVVYANRGTCATWLNDETIICQTTDLGPWMVCICKVGQPGQWAAYWGNGCNQLAAGGGLWQCWLSGVDCFGEYGHLGPDVSLGLTDNDNRGYAGPGGEINLVPAGGLGITIHARSGVVAIPFGAARDVQVLGPSSAVWRDDAGLFYAQGVTCPAQASGGSNPRYCVLPDGTPWIVYSSSAFGLIAHPADDASSGIVLAAPGVNAFYPDARVVNGKLVAAWSSGAGELPGELVVCPDVLAQPWTTFGTAPVDPIAVIGRGCYCGFFEFVPPGDLPPGGVQLFIRCEGHADGALMLPDGTTIGQWVEGTSVEEIESKAASAPAAPVAYWDSRQWPRFPVLPSPSWLCLQAYCGANEPIADFERNMRATIDAAPAGQALALVCQVYTSNLELTTNLAGLVPVFSRLARDYPNITLLLGFTDQGRATGLCDHPEVRPLWDELAAGIPSYPDVGPTPEPPNPEPPNPEPPMPPADQLVYDFGPCQQYANDRWPELPHLTGEEQSAAMATILYELRAMGHPFEMFLKSSGQHWVGWDGQSYSEDVCVVVQDGAKWWKDIIVMCGDPAAYISFGNASDYLPPSPGDESKCVPPPEPPDAPEPLPPMPAVPYGPGYLRTEFGDYLRAKKKGGELQRGDAQLLTLADEGDGRVSIRIGGSGRYVCADPNVPDDPLMANRDTVGPWERFTVAKSAHDETKLTLQAESSGFFVCAEEGGKVVANRTSAGGWESFTFEPD